MSHCLPSLGSGPSIEADDNRNAILRIAAQKGHRKKQEIDEGTGCAVPWHLQARERQFGASCGAAACYLKGLALASGWTVRPTCSLTLRRLDELK